MKPEGASTTDAPHFQMRGVMAQAAGVDLGRLLTLTEGTDAGPVRPVFAGAMRSMAADSAPVTPIADQQITVTADATLVYAMGK